VPRLRILVVDDDEVWRRGFRRLVEDQPGWELVGETIEVSDAGPRVAETSADVVVVGATGGILPLGTLEEIKTRRPDARVIVFGAHPQHEVVRGLLEAGVLAIVSKTDSIDTVRQTIEAASNDKIFLSPVASEPVIEQYLSASRPPRDRPSSQTLTSRERDVVRLLAEGKTNRAAAAELEISVKTVENHRANAMRKLGARSVGDLVRAAIRAGLIEG
jgi:DNA-binding NarL/FixJ family response regulator